MTKAHFTKLAIAILLLCTAASEANARTVVEQVIADDNPCSALDPVDKLDDVSVKNVDISLRGNDVSLSFSGKLSCRTSDSAFIKGKAKASIKASAKLNLANCGVTQKSVDLSDFGGDFASILSAAQSFLEASLEEQLVGQTVEACNDFRAGN